MHLSVVTTALPLLEAAGLHLYSLARLMLFAFFVSKGSLVLCELHSTESTIASYNTQLVRLEIMHSASRLLSTCSGSLKRDTPHLSACWGLGRVQTHLLAFLCESKGLLYKLAPI